MAVTGNDGNSKDINLIFKAELDTSAKAVKDLKKQIQQLQQMLKDEGIQLKIEINKDSTEKMDKESKKTKNKLREIGSGVSEGVKEGVRDAEKDIKRFQSLIEKVNKQLTRLQNERTAELVRARKEFDQLKKYDIYSRIQEAGGIRRPSEGDQFRSDYLNEVPKRVRDAKEVFKPQRSGAMRFDEMADYLNISQDELLAALRNGTRKFDQSHDVDKSTMQAINNKEEGLKKLINTYQQTIEKEESYDKVVTQSNKTVREQTLAINEETKRMAEKSKAQEEQYRRTKANLEKIAALQLKLQKKVMNPDGTPRSFEEQFVDHNTAKTTTVQRDASGKAHTIIETQANEQLRRQRAAMNLFLDEYMRKLSGLSKFDSVISTEKLDKLSSKLSNLNLDNFNQDSKEAKKLVSELEKELNNVFVVSGKVNTERNRLINEAKKMSIRGTLPNEKVENFGNAVIGTDSIDKVNILKKKLEELKVEEQHIVKIKAEEKKAQDEINKSLNYELTIRQRMKSMIETSQSNLGKQALSLASTGKINREDFEMFEKSIKNVDSALNESDAFQRLSAIRGQIEEINKQYKLEQAFNKNTLMSDRKVKLSDDFNVDKIDLDRFRAELSKLNIGIEENRIRTISVDKATGRWSVTLKENSKQNRELSGVLNKSRRELILQGEAIKEASNADKGMRARFEHAIKSVPVWMGAMTVFYGTLRGIKDMISTVVQLDSQMTELKRVMDKKTNFDAMLQSSIKMAKELSVSVFEVNEAMIGFARQGFSAQETLDLTQAAITAMNVSSLSAGDAMDALTAVMVQFNVEASNSMSIVDKLNEVDNNFAITTADLAEAVKKAGSTAHTFGVTLDSLLGNITAIGEATRESGENIGNGLKTIYSRLTSKQAENAFAAIGMSIKDMNGQTMTATEVLDELNKRWSGLTASQKQNLGVAVAGRYQLSRFLALMNNYNTSVRATETSLTSFGSATRENEQYQKSLQARINRLKVAWQDFSNTVGDKVLTDAITLTLRGLTVLTNTFDRLVGGLGAFSIGLTVAAAGFAAFYPKVIKSTGELIKQMKAADGLNAKYKVLKVSIKGVGLALGSFLVWEAAFFAIGKAIDFVINKIGQWRERQEYLTKINKENIDSLNDQIVGIKELGARYEELKNKANKTSQEQTELLDIQHKLVEVYGVSITGINAQGVAYTDSIALIKERTKALEDELDKELALNELRIKTTEQKDLKDIRDAKKEVEDKQNTINDLEKELAELRKKQANKELIRPEDFPNARKAGVFDVKIPVGVNDPLTVNRIYNQMIENSSLNLQNAISLANKDLEEANDQLNKSLENRKTVFTQLADQYVRQLVNSGKKVSDEQRKFINSLAASFANEEDKYDNLKGNFKDVIDSITNSGVQDLITEHNKLIDEFTKTKSSEVADQIRSSYNKIGDVIDSFPNRLGSVDQKTRAMFKEMLNKWKLDLQNMVDLTTAGQLDFSIDTESLTDQVNSAKKEFSDLNDAIATVREEGKLSGEDIVNLVLQYGELAGSVKKTADGYSIEVSALEDVRKSRLDYYDDILRQETKTTNVMRDELAKRLKITAAELANIKTVADARQKAEQIKYDFVPNDSLSKLPVEVQKQVVQYKQESEKTQQMLIEWGQNMETYQALANTLFDKTFGSKKTNKNAAEDVELKKLDEFSQKLAEIDIKIKQSEYAMSQYTSTSEEYRKELEVQIGLLENKQDLSKKEMETLKARKIELTEEMNRLQKVNKLNNDQKKKLNDVIDKLENTNDSINNLTTSWYDLQTTIDSKTFEIVTSKIDQMRVALNKLDNEMDISNSKMRMAEEDSLAYRTELQKQIILLQRKKDEVKKDMDFIVEQMKNVKNVQMKDELTNQLNDLEREWWDYSAQIVEAQKRVKDNIDKIADDIVDIYKDMFEKQKELSINAIEMEQDRLEKLHEQKMKEYDDEIDKIEKVIQAKIDSIEKTKKEDDYQKNINKLYKDREDIQKQINIVSLNNSQEAQVKKQDLLNRLADINDEIASQQREHKDDAAKQALEDELQQERDRIDQAKENQEYETFVVIDGYVKMFKGKYDVAKEWLDEQKKLEQKAWDDRINDDRYFAKIREQVISGHFDKIKSDFANFATILQNGADVIGKSLSQNLIDKIDIFSNKLDGIDFSKIVDQMKKNSEDWAKTSDAMIKKQLADANLALGAMIGATRDERTGIWYDKFGNLLYGSGSSSGAGALAGILPKHHEGGVVGDEPSGISKLISDLFNTKPNERVVKALKDEVMIPKSNIMKNFIPNMLNFAELIANGNSSAGDVNYHLDINIEKITGDEKGGKQVVETIIKGIKKLGKQV